MFNVLVRCGIILAEKDHEKSAKSELNLCILHCFYIKFFSNGLKNRNEENSWPHEIRTHYKNMLKELKQPSLRADNKLSAIIKDVFESFEKSNFKFFRERVKSKNLGVAPKEDVLKKFFNSLYKKFKTTIYQKIQNQDQNITLEEFFS